MGKYKISIMVAVYNVEPYIRQAIDSILNQTIGHENLEVIMVDDLSTDKSGKIMDEYSAKHENFISIHLSENSGACGRPRNVAMKRATAEYFMFLDPDDYLAEDACKQLYEKIEKTGNDMVFGYFSAVTQNGEIIYDKSAAYKELTEFDIEGVEENPSIFRTYSCWTKIYRKKVIMNNNFTFPEKIAGQDTVFLVNYLLVSKGISYINKPIYYYRVREKGDKSVSFNRNVKLFNDMDTIHRLIYDSLKQKSKLKYISELLTNTAGYYIQAIIDTVSLSDSETYEILKRMKWLFSVSKECGILPKDEAQLIIFNLILVDDIDAALKVTKAVRSVRIYLLEVLEGKNWLEKQWKNQGIIINELKNWSNELERAKEWLNGQLKNERDELRHVKEANALLSEQLRKEQLKPWYKKLIGK